ncbi:MAG: uroporphyrinogen-III C-methyltransferase [Candidatus Nitrotoga sp. SPKER]|nr:MAG: uroporphyrinogen-III C-methyltransferase [Candidatus Nitrotoga sp. SPKER]
MKIAQVYLIGAGPGSLELLTLGAVRAIGLADAILIDDLVNPDVLEFAQSNAQIIHVGKRGGCDSTPQIFIHKQMISLAGVGKVVARIKGGDPFMFGRGGEELQALRQAGISVSVISGITSGMAVTASLNIPLTHRNYTHGVTFVTGHTQGTEEPNWHALAKTGTTLVIYMGMSNLKHIVQQLIVNGLPADIPAAAIQNGTLPNQRQVVTTLGKIESLVIAEKIASPAIVVIGEVVRFAEMTEQISQQLAA